MTSMSRTASTEPSTWMTFSSSKQRTTCTIASHSRMLARNLLPKPSPFDAPATNPAMSTNSSVAGTIFCELFSFPSCSRRGSGTPTTPTLGSMVQNGKLAACAAPFSTMALKSVDLPTLGKPTIPVCSFIETRLALNAVCVLEHPRSPRKASSDAVRRCPIRNEVRPDDTAPHNCACRTLLRFKGALFSQRADALIGEAKAVAVDIIVLRVILWPHSALSAIFRAPLARPV
mmetsp:Transcript_3112/g.8671  ORF Transcript_3112/g.8671 Transcript_3112/m.8671 type:complete len:231 (-) Transcript_3112:153-845(-)